jgi:hypothetical protein
MDQVSIEKLSASAFELEKKLARIERLEQELTRLRNEDVITLDQLTNGLTEHRKNRKEISINLANIEERKQAINTKPLMPAEIENKLNRVFHNEVNPKLYDMLIPTVIDRVEIYAYKIKVFLLDGTDFELERILFGSSRALPLFSCVATHSETELKSVRICYFYKSAHKVGGLIPLDESEFFDAEDCYIEWDYVSMGNQIYNHDGLEIYTIGENQKPFSWPSKNNRKRRQQMLDYVINPDNYDLPDYLKTLKSQEGPELE